MKSSGAGNPKGPKLQRGRYIVMTIAGTMALLWSYDAPAAIERRSWMVEQWAQVPSPAPTNESRTSANRTQLTINGLDYGDTLSAQAAALVDLSAVEISLKASQRIFLGLSDEGKFLSNALADEDDTLGAGIARYFETSHGQFGRLGVEYFRSLPGVKLNYLKLGLSGGTRNTPGQPWFIQLDTNLFLSIPHRNDFLTVRGTSGKVWTLAGHSELALSGFLSWTYRMYNMPADGIFEHMLFTLGPSASYRAGFGELKLDLLFRLWLDGDQVQAERVGYPSEFGPSLSFSWTVFF